MKVSYERHIPTISPTRNVNERPHQTQVQATGILLVLRATLRRLLYPLPEQPPTSPEGIYHEALSLSSDQGQPALIRSRITASAVAHLAAKYTSSHTTAAYDDNGWHGSAWAARKPGPVPRGRAPLSQADKSSRTPSRKDSTRRTNKRRLAQ